jgi:hypothetical protein
MNDKYSILILVGDEVVANYKGKELLPSKQGVTKDSQRYHYKEFDSVIEKAEYLSGLNNENLEIIVIDDFDSWLNRWWNRAGMDIQILLFDVFNGNSFWDKLHTSAKWDIYNLAKIKTKEVEIQKDEEKNLVKIISGELAEIALYYQRGIPVEMMTNENGCFYEMFQDSFNRFYDVIENRMINYTPIENPESNYETIKITFAQPIRSINKMFDDTEHWGVANLKGWVESYDSSRFTQIDERSAIITSEYSMQYVEEWLMKNIGMDSIEIIIQN